MGQVAFDTLKFVETLEKEGLPKNQAKAISLAVRESHEAVDVATKADIADVKRDIADVRKEIADVRKDLSAEIADVRKDLSAEMNLRFERVDAQISDVRKDLQLEMSSIRAEQKLIRWMLGAGILGILSLVVKAFLIPAL
ncbi:hypothetical protein [Candidatus Arsenophonus triatominarum]|uniref:hypothetical protein n=1 Tax=Candidatus Arsenophonus triatominarum TaxID=57911 RepID=UPI0007C573B6|nr:hypothetical protein [Candidatus Arsenophonus triatominarum]